MDLLKGLNKQQKKAVLHTEGPLLVVAGAGTGKTKVITHRIAHLIEKGVEPDKILAVTFTNKAAREMKERVIQLAKTGCEESAMPIIGTFHAIASDILRKYGSRIGIPGYFLILDEQESLEIIKNSIEKLGLDLRQFRPNSIQNLISQKKSSFNENNESAFAKATADEDFFPKNFNLIWQKYRERLQRQNALDFDDLIQKTVFLFENEPEVLQIYQEKWPYINIDEYQDTDSSQARLVHLLGQKYCNVCAVGDEDQSIYGFRGADFSNILNFEKTWPEAKIMLLERNYRSTQKILNAANAVISKNQLRRVKNLFTKEEVGVKLAAFEANDERAEAEFVAAKIKELLQKNTLASPIAILCRANFQFPAFEQALTRHSLPYEVSSNQDSLLSAKQPARLMTVHAAKGLEFKYVFIPGLEKGLFPYQTSNKTPAEAEEERRLFYVALTRGQKKIYLSYSKFRTSFGTKQINQPSPFLSDIPPSLIKWL